MQHMQFLLEKLRPQNMNILTKYATYNSSPDFVVVVVVVFCLFLFFNNVSYPQYTAAKLNWQLEKNKSEILSSKSIFQNLESISYYSAGYVWGRGDTVIILVTKICGGCTKVMGNFT